MRKSEVPTEEQMRACREQALNEAGGAVQMPEVLP
jgi:hypothetical protein